MPATERRSPLPASGEGIPVLQMPMGGDGSAASAGTPAQMASRLQVGPGMTPSDQSSRGVSVPRARRSGTGKRSMSARSGSGAIGKDAAPLAPAKALKTVARATLHSAPQPPPIVDIVAEAAKLRVAMARGAQQARAPGNGGDAGQSGVKAAAQAEAVGETGWGGADDAARPDVEVGAGRSDADGVAWPVAKKGASGGAQEHPASQTEMETLVPEPPRAGVEGVAEEDSASSAPVAEETRVLVSAEAQDEGVVAAVTAQAAPENVVPVVQLPDSIEEFGDSRDIDPAAAASATDKIAEFTSVCEEVLERP